MRWFNATASTSRHLPAASGCWVLRTTSSNRPPIWQRHGAPTIASEIRFNSIQPPLIQSPFPPLPWAEVASMRRELQFPTLKRRSRWFRSSLWIPKSTVTLPFISPGLHMNPHGRSSSLLCSQVSWIFPQNLTCYAVLTFSIKQLGENKSHPPQCFSSLTCQPPRRPMPSFIRFILLNRTPVSPAAALRRSPWSEYPAPHPQTVLRATLKWSATLPPWTLRTLIRTLRHWTLILA